MTMKYTKYNSVDENVFKDVEVIGKCRKSVEKWNREKFVCEYVRKSISIQFTCGKNLWNGVGKTKTRKETFIISTKSSVQLTPFTNIYEIARMDYDSFILHVIISNLNRKWNGYNIYYILHIQYIYIFTYKIWHNKFNFRRST